MPHDKKPQKKSRRHVELTDRPPTPELEGGPPLPEELTGRASATGEDLTALFRNEAPDHLADGFRGGSNSDRQTDIPLASDTTPRGDDDVTAD